MQRHPARLFTSSVELIMINLSSRVFLTFLVLIGPAVSNAQSYRVRDSAGVAIAENPARRSQRVTLDLEDKPRMEVGGLDAVPANEFDAQTGTIRGAILSDGGLAVIDVDRIHYFDRTGKRLRIAGRLGSGPGEFIHLTSICRTRGDTIVVFDLSGARLSVLDGAGQFVRAIPQTEYVSNLPLDACFDDGTFLLLNNGVDPRTNLHTRVNATRVTVGGTTIGDAGVFDRQSGRRWTLLAAGSKMYLGAGSVSEVRVYSQAGALKSIVRSDDPVRAMTESEMDEVISRTIPTNVSSSERSARMSQQRNAMGHANIPAYSQFAVDPDGRIWVADFTLTNTEPMGWSLFEGDGRLAGRLAIPRNFRESTFVEVVAFGKNEVLLSRRDSDGAKRLGIYRIVPARANK